jgi:small subunit ribosomal protein S20
MPNIKSAKKRVKQSEKRHIRNMSRKSAIKTAIKKVLVAIEGSEVAQAKELLRDVQAKIARAKGKGVLHRNTAARKVSRLAKKVSEAEKAAA